MLPFEIETDRIGKAIRPMIVADQHDIRRNHAEVPEANGTGRRKALAYVRVSAQPTASGVLTTRPP
jgi:hypothetical protein